MAERTPRAAMGDQMGGGVTERCKTCRHWWHDPASMWVPEAVRPMEPVTLDRPANEDEERARFGYTVRRCNAPKVAFYERPAADGRGLRRQRVPGGATPAN